MECAEDATEEENEEEIVDALLLLIFELIETRCIWRIVAPPREGAGAGGGTGRRGSAEGEMRDCESGSEAAEGLLLSTPPVNAEEEDAATVCNFEPTREINSASGTTSSSPSSSSPSIMEENYKVFGMKLKQIVLIRLGTPRNLQAFPFFVLFFFRQCLT